MISLKQGRVKEILSRRSGVTHLEVEIDGESQQAINYDGITGDIDKDDAVILNTTAVELSLGTGGIHYVLWNLGHRSIDLMGRGHIMKLRYTPMQINCLAAEEPDSPFHDQIAGPCDLEGMPVIVGSLHSQLPATAAAINATNPNLRIAYIMTDAGALPIAFSRVVNKLKELSLIDKTITCGHAFGGDYEAVNVFSALAVAKRVVEADICIVIMGPGIVGTKTVLGYSGIEQGQILNAVGCLKGLPIAMVRLHFADQRSRHYGVSHHTLTSLSLATLVQSVVAIPDMVSEKREVVLKQLDDQGITSKHKVVEIEDNITLDALNKFDIQVTTMGRGIDEEPDFFRAAGAAGICAFQETRKDIA